MTTSLPARARLSGSLNAVGERGEGGKGGGRGGGV